MAYRFASGTSDYVRFAVSPLNAVPFGPFTWAFFVKHNVTATTAATLALTDSSDTARTYARFGSADQLQIVSPVNTGPTLSGTTLWYLCAVTVSGSTGIPRFHVHDGTSWTHTNGASNYSTLTVASSDRLYVGCAGVGVLPLSADVVCAGIKKTAATDLQVETLSRTQFSAWQSFGFDWLIGFDSSFVSGGLLQDQASPGTGDETTRSGTTLVSDPPSWAWVTVTPVANFTGTPLSGTEPLSVTFTDSSTNTPTSWAWTFGDGGTSTAQNPSHSYTTAGTYTVVLVATNSAGSNTLTRTGYVTVSDQPRPIRINTSQGWADIGDASSFVSGSGAPTVAQGATGAIYLDSATGLHYGPKAGGAWPGAALPVPAGTPSDATTSAKGVVQLAGDLAGTAASPQIAAGVIVNADVNAAAALARSKLDFGTGLVNSDIATAAAIAKTKLAALAIVDTDVAAGAAIAEAKLSLASDAVAGTASRRTLGSGATQAAAGNDPRFPILATTPPGSPVDGQEWLLQASGCPTWLFRYNSSNATAYKWEFIGGAVLNSTENIDQVVPTGTPTVFGPLFAVPRPGYWLLRHFSVAYMSSAPPANSYFIATLSTYPSYGILSGAVANAVGISAVNNEMPNAIEQTVLLASAQSVGIGLMASGANVTSRRRMHSLQPVNIS